MRYIDRINPITGKSVLPKINSEEEARLKRKLKREPKSFKRGRRQSSSFEILYQIIKKYDSEMKGSLSVRKTYAR